MSFEMNMVWACILLPIGLAILIKGADVLVDGAVGLAESFGVSPLVIGLTIVAMGTSAPEVAASVAAALDNLGDAAIGNVYGSNIANLALVGGICAMIRPIEVKTSMIRREIPVMVLVALMLWPLLAPDLKLGRIESISMLILFAGMIVYTVWASMKEAKSKPEVNAEIAKELAEHTPDKKRTLGMNLILTVIGLIALAGGAKISLLGAVYIGQWFGLSTAVIGITILAVGTSLPELITCLVAAIKGHDDLSIGNLVGSNIFNTLLVLGTAGTIMPFEDINKRLVGTDFWAMVTVSVVFMSIVMISKKIGRTGGILLLTIYCVYMGYVFIFTSGV